jgi:hypothetical protein
VAPGEQVVDQQPVAPLYRDADLGWDAEPGERGP